MHKILETETVQQRYIRAKELAKYMNISPTTVWWISRNNESFPKPKKLTPQITVWDIDAVNDFMETLK